MEKNRDPLSGSLVSVMKASTVTQIASLLCDDLIKLVNTQIYSMFSFSQRMLICLKVWFPGLNTYLPDFQFALDPVVNFNTYFNCIFSNISGQQIKKTVAKGYQVNIDPLNHIYIYIHKYIYIYIIISH